MPRQGLNRRRILEEALAAVDEAGLDELTMRRLGERLGVEAPSLYKHVSSKTEILDGLVELVYEEVDFAGIDGDFRQRVLGYTRSFREALLRHPHVVPLVASQPVVDRRTLTLVEVALGEMVKRGFSPAEARKYLNVVFGFVVGHTLGEVGARAAGVEKVMEARRAVADASLPYVMATLVSEPVGYDAEFELGIDLIVAGIEQAALSTAATVR